MAIDDNTSYELTGYQVKDLANKVRAKADSASLASVATSGLYSDLTGKPTIPTVNNGTLTIQQNGTSVQTFTANQSTNTTANIETIYSVDVSSTQPVTQVVSTAMIQDGAVTSAKIDWSTTPQSYSTSEVNTGATWIDGKPIYKKTINMGALPTGGATTTSDVSSLNIETLVDYRGIAWNPTNRNFRILPFIGDSMDNMLRVDVQNVSDVHTLRIISTTGGAWTGYTKSYVTLWYTKTTD